MDAMTKGTQAALHFATAAVAGPALVGVSLFYPASKPVRVFIGATGVLLTLSHYAFFDEMMRLRNKSA
jgi:hypothetical protein